MDNLVGVNNTIENSFNNSDNVTSQIIEKNYYKGDVVKRVSAVQDAIDTGLLSSEI